MSGELRTVPKFTLFHLFAWKMTSEPYQNLHGSVCLHERWIQNCTKICMAPSVYMKDEFRTVPKFSRFCLFTWKTNSEPYQNLHGPSVHMKDEFKTVPKFACLRLFTCMKDEFRTVPKFTRFRLSTWKTNFRTVTKNLHHAFRLFTWKTNSAEPYLNICTFPAVYKRNRRNSALVSKSFR